MSTAPVKSLIDEQLEQIEQIERSLAIIGAGVPRDLPEAMEMPGDRVLMLFKGPTLFEAKQAAAEAFIENPEAVTRSWWMCGEWTLGYEVRL